MLEFLKNRNIMIVVAHPDDELLGLGATMNMLIKDFNVNTHVVILGEGITSRSSVRDVTEWSEELQIHKQNMIEAQAEIGYHSIKSYDFPDNRFDSVSLLDIIKVVESEKNLFMPSVIFTHHGGDLNIDHQRTFQAVMTACRPIKEEIVKAIFTFETPSGTEWQSTSDPRIFAPNVYFEIQKTNLDAKIRAMEKYKYEKRQFPHPRSPQALDIQSQRCGISVGANYAESFQLIRLINVYENR